MTDFELAALDAYIACAFWVGTMLPASEDESMGDEKPEDRFEPSDLHPKDAEKFEQDFLAALHSLPEGYEAYDPEQIGHDLWLTREGHGAGFWDRGDNIYPKSFRDAATEACKHMGRGGYFWPDVDGETLHWES